MVIKNLLKSLEQEGQTEVASILQEARDEASRILADGEREHQAIQDTHMDRTTLQLKEEREQRLNLARRHSQFEITAAKKKFVQKAFQEARDRLAKLREGSLYHEVFANLTSEALEMLPGRQKLTVEIDKRDAAVAQQVLGQLSFNHYEVRTNLHCLGGLKAWVHEGHTAVDNTIDARLARARKVLETDIANSIYGE